jgi:phosphoribosylaminoimidazole-succinocarboxamide synthase
VTKQALKETNFEFPGQIGFYRGKVRDVYEFEDKLIIVASDRISAFDVILPEPIPNKGQVLNQIATEFLNQTRSLVPNWLESSPDPNVSIGKKCEPFKVEMVIRGYLAGHAWREYNSGKRSICGVSLPDNLKQSQRLPEPIITPTTKAAEGHDEDISKEDIIESGIVSPEDYEILENYTRRLFEFGTNYAHQRGLLLVDTKYEFGKYGDQILLIDEVHTPDSSRYFYEEGYEERLNNNEPQKQLSKEFVREWLIENNFQGKDGEVIPTMTAEKLNEISGRYIELYEKVLGKPFEYAESGDISDRIKKSIENYLN